MATRESGHRQVGAGEWPGGVRGVPEAACLRAPARNPAAETTAVILFIRLDTSSVDHALKGIVPPPAAVRAIRLAQHTHVISCLFILLLEVRTSVTRGELLMNGRCVPPLV